MAGGTASGMAPAARLVAYKVLWSSSWGGDSRAEEAGIIAAVNQGVADGVDVISLSLGVVNPTDTYFDNIAFLNANLAGVVVTFAGGNSGSPGFATRTIDNYAPFYLTVGASTIAQSGIILASSAGAAESASSTNQTSPSATPSSTNQTSPSATPSSTNQTSPSATPSSTNQTSPAATPAATPSPGESAPKVADFSSTGPLAFPTAGPSNGHANDCILKPDILGPGVDLYAAAPGTRVGNKGGSNQVSGISMATPHLAGIAALVMQKYPSWSPAQVMSAIMTTATTKDFNGAAISSKRTKIATTPWDMGNGHVFPPKALDPGLTFDAQKSEYLNFLAGLDMKRTWAEYPKEKLTAVPPRDLNRPTISVAPLKGSITVTRTVTSVPDSASTYTAKVEKPQGVEVTVKPSRFTISPGKKVRFVVTFKVTQASEDFQYGSLTWVDEKGHSVRSAIAVKPVGK